MTSVATPPTPPTAPATERRAEERRGVQTPDVTILMPCLDEVLTLPTCIEWAHAAAAELREHGLTSEILISDNGSTDGSIEYARKHGCRVVHCPKRGYGYALIWGGRAARGKYIVMGDSDASYDFREGVPMVLRLKEGYDVCMGNRFKGRIMPGAMPWKNKYIGNPTLSGLLNVFYRAGVHDAHSGLRAITKEAFNSLKLSCGGMEFASEMVVKAALHHLKMTEVPITLHVDGRDREPHLRPWRDGYRHLRFLVMMSPLWLYFIPSALLLMASCFIISALLTTPAGEVWRVGPLWVGDHWMILAGGGIAIGYSAFLAGLSAWVFSIRQGARAPTRRFDRLRPYMTVESALAFGALLVVAGLGTIGYVVANWSEAAFGNLQMTREMVLATSLLVMGFQTLFGGCLLAFLGDPAHHEIGWEAAETEDEALGIA